MSNSRITYKCLIRRNTLFVVDRLPDFCVYAIPLKRFGMKSQRGTNDANGLPESYPAARSVSDGIRETLRSGNAANETKTAAAGNRNRTKASLRLPNILPDNFLFCR